MRAWVDRRLCAFDDVDGFRVYADHPEHLRVIKELIGPYIEGRHPVQFMA